MSMVSVLRSAPPTKAMWGVLTPHPTLPSDCPPNDDDGGGDDDHNDNANCAQLYTNCVQLCTNCAQIVTKTVHSCAQIVHSCPLQAIKTRLVGAAGLQNVSEYICHKQTLGMELFQ